MKKHILYVLLFITSFSQAQSVTDNFAGWANVVSVLGNTIQITQFNGNPTKFGDTFVLSDMQIGDVLWTSSCSRFIITAKTVGTLTISDPDPGLSVFPYPGERIGFTREELVNGFLIGSVPQNGDGNAGAISGISITSAACILTYYTNNIKNAIQNNVIKNETISVNTAYTPTTLPSNIEVNTTNNPVNVTLPTLPALTTSDKEVTIYNKSGGTNPINIIVNGSVIATLYNNITQKIICTDGVWATTL